MKDTSGASSLQNQSASRFGSSTSIASSSGRNANENMNNGFNKNQNCRYVKVLYTGGTIGMVRNKEGVLTPLPHEFEKRIRRNPQMHDEEYAKQLFGVSAEMAPLVLPDVPGIKRVVYSIYEFEELLDSSNMTMDDWSKIAEDIHQMYDLFDGFVILHGTDTLPYTASALSFMLENLGKTVIVTGSQIPIFEVRSDGIDNFLGSLLIAGNYLVPEVSVYFNYNLFRGNRTVKISSGSFRAFASPNFMPLAKVGIKIDINYRAIFRPCTIERFTVHSKLNKNVGILRIYPSIATHTVKAFLQPPIEGVVIQTYGAGNIPNNRPDLTATFKEATQRGVVIINCTQCSKGAVSEIYSTGKFLYDSGVISGHDMTPEAALAKLAYVLSMDQWDIETKRTVMQGSLRGELTGERASFQQEFDLVDAVARSLHISFPNEASQLDSILFPAMLCSAVEKGDKDKLAELKGYGANMSATNADLRTPLHIASANGNLSIVQFLLLNGASVHLRDRYEQTPLLEAIANDHEAVVRLLRQCGAHLTLSPSQIGERLCNAASYGLVERLRCYRTAGANLSQPDQIGRTALHTAVLCNKIEVVKYLLQNKVTVNKKDDLGFTAADIANQRGLISILELFSKYFDENPLEQTNGEEL